MRRGETEARNFNDPNAASSFLLVPANGIGNVLLQP